MFNFSLPLIDRKANQCSAGYEGLNCGQCVFGYFGDACQEQGRQDQIGGQRYAEIRSEL